MLAELRVEAVFLCFISYESMFAFTCVYFECWNKFIVGKA